MFGDGEVALNGVEGTFGDDDDREWLASEGTDTSRESAEDGSSWRFDDGLQCARAAVASGLIGHGSRPQTYRAHPLVYIKC